MILDEATARTKWCPFTRTGTAGTNNREDFDNKTKCLASGCMCWVWQDAGHTVGLCGLVATNTGFTWWTW